MLPPPLPARPKVPRAVYWTAAGAGFAYGIFMRLFFGLHRVEPIFNVMTIGFLFFVPLGLGFLTIYVGEASGRWPWGMRIFFPWAPAMLSLGAALCLAWEGIICVFLWVPLFLIMATLGSLLGVAARSMESNNHGRLSLACCLMIPFVLTPIETHIRAPLSIRTVETQIDIRADPAVIWDQIKRVAPIRREEQRKSLAQWIGFPRPIEATLSKEGIGGVRHASFEGNVVFIETVHTWQPEERLGFSIQTDPSSIPPNTLDEHVTVGGAFFDVLNGEYRIERTGPKHAVLHLASQHRLSTHFNFYAGLWTDFIMRDVQQNILEVIRRRCEGM